VAESVNGEKKDNSRDRIAAIVFAAGESTRFSPLGEPKQLALVGGEAMIAKVVREVTASAADAVLVVLGHEFERVSAALAGFDGIEIISNPGYQSGLSSSLKAGLAQASGFDAVIFVLGDLPGLTAGDINLVISAYRSSPAPLAVGLHEGRPVHPVIFRKDLWPELDKISGDIGGREVAKRHLDEAVTVEMPNAASIIDIDTLQDYLPLSGGSDSE
jgi:molybdenum cofactor cytidylyltransferase